MGKIVDSISSQYITRVNRYAVEYIPYSNELLTY
jgi:hypothetical protein